MNFAEIVITARNAGASDFFIIPGQPVSFKHGGVILPVDGERMTHATAGALVRDAYAAAERSMERVLSGGDDDFAISFPGVARIRMSIYRQRGSLAAVGRIVAHGIPDHVGIGIPDNVMSALSAKKGLALVTGPAGSGKSTTLACVIDQLNHTRCGHIITLEDPIEFLYSNDKCIISQREIGIDTADYATGLRASLRQAPDIILLGEMRDLETIRVAMTAAETGHLVLSTLHTVGASNTIDRIIDIFPPVQQQQIRVQLAMLLSAVVSQQLVPSADGGSVPAFEVMNVTGAIRNIIREAKTHQLDSVIATSAGQGMISMDQSLTELYRTGKITRETALSYAQNPDAMQTRLKPREKNR